MNQLIRTFAPELEVRSAAKGGDGRTVEGIAVPYNVKQRINPNLVEQFARGAFDHQIAAAHRVYFTREHLDLGGTLIGKAVELRDDAAGLWGAWRVSNTDAGNETLELIKDGVLEQMSVGFRAKQNRREQDGTITRVTADLMEVCVTLQGAYGEGALVSAVRSASDPEHVCTCGQIQTRTTSNAERARQMLAGMPMLPA